MGLTVTQITPVPQATLTLKNNPLATLLHHLTLVSIVTSSKAEDM